MPLLRKGVLIPVKGIDFSQPSTFIDDRAGFPVNMRYYRSELRKRPGKTVLNEIVADSTQIMGLGKLEIGATGLKYLLRASKTALERLNTDTDTWDAIAATPFSGGNEDFFSFVTVTESGFIVITNYVDRPRKWNGAGNNTVLGGSPPRAKFCAYLSPYLILAYTDDGVAVKPWELQWSDTDAPEVWSGGNSGSALLSDEPSPIQNILKLNEFLAVYKSDSIYLGRKVDTADVFQFDPIKTGIGLAASRCVVDAEGVHYFMGQNNFYAFNGIRVDDIGGPVRDEVFSRINRDKIQRCFALHVQELNEVWFFVIIAGYDWPTEIWKYNYKIGYWFQDTCDQLTCAIKWQSIVTQSWDSDPGAWDDDQGPWDSSPAGAKWEDIIFGDSAGYCHQLDYTTTNDNGVAVAAVITSKDFTGDQLEFNKRWQMLDVWAKGPGKLYIDYSIDEGDTWVNIPYNSTTAYLQLTGANLKYSFYFDVLSDKIRFRFRNAETGETFFLRNFYPYYQIVEEGQLA